MIYNPKHIRKLNQLNEISFLLFICVRKMFRMFDTETDKQKTELINSIEDVIGKIYNSLEYFEACDLVMEPIIVINVQTLCNDLKLEKYYINGLKLKVEKLEKLIREIDGTK